MDAIPVGAKGSFTLLVSPQHLANQFKDAMLPPVLATPVMIMIMENAALDAVRTRFGDEALDRASAREANVHRRLSDRRPR